MAFTPTARDRIRRVHTFSSGAAGVSSNIVGHVSKYAQNIGATIIKHQEKKSQDGAPPGLLNKTLMAFSTISTGVETAGKSLLNSSTTAATQVVTHRWGDEAGEVSQSIGGNFKNVALVYIDVTGVSRKAIVQSLAKGMVVGKVGENRHLVVPGSEDNPSGPTGPPPGVVPTLGRVPSALDKAKPPKMPPRPKQQNWKEKEAAEGRYTDADAMMSGGRSTPNDVVDGMLPPPPGPPPTYGSGVGAVLDETEYIGDVKQRWG